MRLMCTAGAIQQMVNLWKLNWEQRAESIEYNVMRDS